ncbi:MAG TPA: N-acetyltransferase [Gammaproteobacteria bacterium]|nr:N-acetyltransferase [Gammaproteobacteria bacterium]
MNNNLPLRRATIADVPGMYALLHYHALRAVLLPRPLVNLYRHVREFQVIEMNGQIQAMAALEIFTHELAEIRSLAVDPKYSKRGLGRSMVKGLIQEATAIGLHRVMALTYVVPFFTQLGFHIVEKETLPEKVWNICVRCNKFNDCDETAMLLYLD